MLLQDAVDAVVKAGGAGRKSLAESVTALAARQIEQGDDKLLCMTITADQRHECGVCNAVGPLVPHVGPDFFDVQGQKVHVCGKLAIPGIVGSQLKMPAASYK